MQSAEVLTHGLSLWCHMSPA